MIHMTNEQTNDATHLALYMFLHLVRVWAKHYRHSRYTSKHNYNRIYIHIISNAIPILVGYHVHLRFIIFETYFFQGGEDALLPKSLTSRGKEPPYPLFFKKKL